MHKPNRPHPEVGRCAGCGKRTDIYVGFDCPEAGFFCNGCNDETMGYEPGFSALLALLGPQDDET